ncbi:hypothetical protein [Microcoleus sp. B9-D4]|uniref:hypothetical protein n=1 Tax=Microcoleus sp. B9-D4 TaxID=2818711 RepID=UPI002FCEF3FC
MWVKSDALTSIFSNGQLNALTEILEYVYSLFSFLIHFYPLNSCVCQFKLFSLDSTAAGAAAGVSGSGADGTGTATVGVGAAGGAAVSGVGSGGGGAVSGTGGVGAADSVVAVTAVMSNE